MSLVHWKNREYQPVPEVVGTPDCYIAYCCDFADGGARPFILIRRPEGGYAE